MLTLTDEEIIEEYFGGDWQLAEFFIAECENCFDAERKLCVKTGKYLEVSYPGEDTFLFAAYDKAAGAYYCKNRRDKVRIYLGEDGGNEPNTLDIEPGQPEQTDISEYINLFYEMPPGDACDTRAVEIEIPSGAQLKDKYEVLKKYFGYDSFKGGQEQVIDAITSGRDVMCVMPTGAGKSICYQVPAMMAGGITVVISPLISLMKDQVQTLNETGIHACFINSSLTGREYAKVMNMVTSGKCKVLYVAPERLTTSSFIELSRHIDISIIAIDEAHCISQWGQDFRPSYLKITEYINLLDKRPVIGAFTATATKEVKADIIRALKLQDPFSITTGFDRPNLTFSVFAPADKDYYLQKTLKKYEGDAGIIYCSTRKTVEAVCDTLNGYGYSATRYHAGLDAEERKQNQDDFINDKVSIVVATNAFGMGIDKSNVSFVIHYNMPKSIENYYQEAGRAGRDGSRADCILLYSAKDVVTNQYLINMGNGNPDLTEEEQEKIRERDHERLKIMTYYATTGDCLRHFILNYFGEWAKPRCDNCSNCLKQFRLVDVTQDAISIFMCIDDMGQRFGASLVSEVLKGSSTDRIRKLGFSESCCYGKLEHRTLRKIREEIDTLIAEEYLFIEGKEYPIIKINIAKANMILEGKASVQMKIYDDEVERTAKKNKKSRGERKFSGDVDRELYDKLKAYRTQKAKTKSVPAYVIFPDRTLEELCVMKPTSTKQLLAVIGFGEKKVQQYGEDITEIIRKHQEIQ